jgi:phosphoribosylamine--glycine ligase
VKLLEYNARLGDPEAMNVLPILKTDFVQICEAILNGNLKDLPVEFEGKATVCKYVVPLAYGLPVRPQGDNSIGARIEIGDTGQARVYYSSVDKREDGLYMTSSRAIGIVGIADDLSEAERIAEMGCLAVKGPVDHRPDIGTRELVEKRIRHMEILYREGKSNE